MQFQIGTLECNLKFQIIFCAIYKKKKPYSFAFLNPNCALGLSGCPGILFSFLHTTLLSHSIFCQASRPSRRRLPVLFTPLPAGKPFPLDRATVFSLIFSSHLRPQKPSSSSQGCHHPRSSHHKEFLLRF